MKAKLQHLLIEAKLLKTGYIVLVTNPTTGKPAFGKISKLNKDGTARVDCNIPITTEDGKTITAHEEIQLRVSKDELMRKVVKLLAILTDYRSFSVIHGDFDQIISKIPSVERFIEGKQKLSIEGTITPIPTYPKVGDVVELTSMDKAERNNMLRSKTDRIGVIKKCENNVFSIEFPSTTLELKRATFKILGNTDTKYVFELDKS